MRLELRGITKRFGSFAANEDVNLTVESGRVHTLLGENGAGKSTLMNVLFGLYEPTEGEILLDGEPVRFSGPGEAMRAGIGMVHQHFMLVPVFTVAENVALGDEHTRALGVLDLEATRRRIREISAQYGFDVDPDALEGLAFRFARGEDGVDGSGQRRDAVALIDLGIDAELAQEMSDDDEVVDIEAAGPQGVS